MTSEAVQASETRGPVRRAAGWVGGHIAQIVVGLVVAVVTPLATGWITPQEIEQTVVKVTGVKLSDSPSVRLRAEGDSDQTKRVAENARDGVLTRLRVPEAAAKAALAYRLTQLELGTGASRKAALQWIVALPGQGQAQCGPRTISFYSTDSLAERVAASLNDSLAASARQGRNLCD